MFAAESLSESLGRAGQHSLDYRTNTGSRYDSTTRFDRQTAEVYDTCAI